MKRPLGKIAAIVVLLLSTAGPPGFGAAITSTVSTSFPIDIRVFIPCAAGVTGVGETTGVKYQGTGETRFDLNADVVAFPLVVTFVNNFKIIGQGPNNNLLVHENFHVTINADGTLTAFLDNFSFT